MDMSSTQVNIPQRRSLMLFAALALFMVCLSYLFTIAMAVVCVYLPWLAVSNVPNFQTSVLFLGGIVVAGIMSWSLVPRRDEFKAPGLLLNPTSHPDLFAEIERIAESLKEPLPREVYLIGDPNAWVADRGGLMGVGSRRVLALGLPLLGALTVSQFRAILAHEFAHYYGGDTSLGPWLHRTQMTMVRTFRGFGSLGGHKLPAVVALLFTVVFKILEWYWLLFLRAINYVSRRQEYRADELACLLVGPESLKSGLRVVHGTALAWPVYWRTEVAPLVDLGCLPSIASGFSQFLAAPNIAKQVQHGIEKQILEAKVDSHDSHPPLRDRLAMAEALAIQPQPEDARPALCLLKDPDVEELKFLEAVNPNLEKNSLTHVSWEDQGFKVLIPFWMGQSIQYSSLLQGITLDNLPEKLGILSQMAPHVPDPKGMLLTPEQRIERARAILGMALGVALVDDGWAIHTRPGEIHFSRGDNQLNPFDLISLISDGKISKDAWAAKCAELGIAGLSLFKGTETTRGTGASAADEAEPIESPR